MIKKKKLNNSDYQKLSDKRRDDYDKACSIIYRAKTPMTINPMALKFYMELKEEIENEVDNILNNK